jgi:hypothetical protein
MTMFGWLRKISEQLWRGGNHVCRSTTAQRPATAQPRLERLEDRLTPTTFNTTTNVALSITPSFFARTATETITATVTQAGTTTPVTSGNVAFNVNGQTGTLALNNAGQASFTTTLPLYAVADNQSLQAFYAGATVGSDTFNNSVFFSPVYLNVLNALFPSNVTFVGPPISQSSLPINPFGSYNGETNSVLLVFVPVDFHYIDSGTIQTFNLFGITFSGSFSAAVFAPYENFYNSLNIQLL